MLLPQHFVETREEVVLELVRRTGFGHLVCNEGLASTPLPFVVDDTVRSLRAHLARPNPIWRCAPCSALLIVPVSDAYVSPGWYPSKVEHGKVVPTWNYEVVHLRGQLELHDDPAWVERQIGDLTDHNEASMPEPWAVDDAPAEYIAMHQRGIVGLELHIERVEAKRKLSQNRSDEDRNGVIRALQNRNQVHSPVAAAMKEQPREN